MKTSTLAMPFNSTHLQYRRMAVVLWLSIMMGGQPNEECIGRLTIANCRLNGFQSKIENRESTTNSRRLRRGHPDGSVSEPRLACLLQATGYSPPRIFAPGVRINWDTKTVEVEAQVVLREGPLELFACTPGTREHESIVTVSARPTHIFQAMGLVGLEPGSPVRYDEKQQQLLPPTGETLQLMIRYREHDKLRTVPVEEWLVKADEGNSPGAIRWVFAGSRLLDDKTLGAEAEGTVVGLVDFDTALIAVDALHTSDNEALWLAANTEKIPPVGTPCTILIRSAAPESIEVDVSADSALHIQGKPTLLRDLVEIVKIKKKNSQEVTFVLRPEKDVSKETVESVIESLAT